LTISTDDERLTRLLARTSIELVKKSDKLFFYCAFGPIPDPDRNPDKMLREAQSVT
jgi:hypothetical protein